jgi:hypothetical protein
MTEYQSIGINENDLELWENQLRFIRNDGVGGSNPSCGTNTINILQESVTLS